MNDLKEDGWGLVLAAYLIGFAVIGLLLTGAVVI